MKITDLFEAYPISLARPYVKNWDRSTNEDIFARFKKFQRGNNSYRLYFDFTPNDMSQFNDIRVMEDVFLELKYINDLSLFVEHYWAPTVKNIEFWNKLFSSINIPINTDFQDSTVIQKYKKGMFLSKDGKEFSIGKMFTKAVRVLDRVRKGVDAEEIIPARYDQYVELIDNLRQSFNNGLLLFTNDRFRQGINILEQPLMVVISRHPYDIAGASTGRSWKSCVSLVDGSKRHFIKSDVDEGAMIAYLVTKNDPNITNPVSRIRIQKFYNSENPSSYVFSAIESVYGLELPGFLKFVKRWCEQVSTENPNGLYCTAKTVQYPTNIVKTGRSLRKWYS